MSRLAISLLRAAAAVALFASLASPAYAQNDPKADPTPQVAPKAPAPSVPEVAPKADPTEPAPPARGRRPGFPPGLAEARLIKERADVIGVGEETLAKLEKLVVEIRQEEEELRARTVETENEVRVLLDENVPEEKALLKAGSAGSDVAQATRQLRLQTSLRVRALLDKEQLEKFMVLRKQAMARRRKTGGRPRR